MTSVWREALRRLEAGEKLVLATVIRTRGSAPGKPGSSILISADGTTTGTVGGGSGEGQVIQEATGLLESDSARWMTIKMLGDEKRPGEMVCGGEMRILLEPLAAGSHIGCLRKLVEEIDRERPVHILRRTPGTENGTTADEATAGSTGASETAAGETTSIAGLCGDDFSLLWREEAHAGDLPGLSASPDPISILQSPDGAEWIVERIAPPDQLVIVGGGHIALPLCEIATQLDFRVTVIDDRPEFSSEDRFPGAARVLTGENSRLLGQIPAGESTYFALLSRGYEFDVVALRIILGGKCRYVGMIGSRRRVATVKRVLEAEGVSREQLDTIHAPIGVDISAVTPAEIATSIAAQLILIRRSTSM